MQTYPFTLDPGAVVGATLFNDWTYSPVKNALPDAAAKVKEGVPGRGALEGELEYYASASKALAALGVPQPPPAAFAMAGFTVPDAPKIVVSPFFANSFEDWRAAFPTPAAISISTRSALLLPGRGRVVFHALQLDGALEIVACEGARVAVKSLRVANAGLAFEPLGEGAAAPDWQKIRGFTVARKEMRTLRFDAPGEYEVAE